MAFSETHAVWQAFRLAPRILVEPHVVLAKQKARQEVKAIKQSNKLIQELKFPGNKTISENAQEEAYKKVFNDPMTEPYRKEAQDRDNLRFQGDDPIIGNPSMSEGTKYVFDEAQDELGTGSGTGFLVMREDGEIDGTMPLLTDPFGPGQCGNEPTLDNEFGSTPAMGEMVAANVV